MTIGFSKLSISNTIYTRLAPTPSGYLHEGNLFNFVLTWALARRHGGKVLLRIDDLDRQRMRPEYLEDIFRTLDWIGLDYDQGPTGPEDFEKNWSQKHRVNQYQEVLNHLKDKDRLYRCTCSRSAIRKINPKGIYPGTCLNTPPPQGVPATLRFQTETDAASWQDLQLGNITQTISEDFVVWKKDGQAAYHLASVVDDLHYKINLVVRGEDLLQSTAAQIVLSKYTNSIWQPQLLHHKLIEGTDGQKLSKSAGAASQSIRHLYPDKQTMLHQLCLAYKIEPVQHLEELPAALFAAN